MGSLSKKVNSLLKNGLEPLEVGMANYLLNDPEIEELALERLELSKKAIEKEPIRMFAISDKRILGLDKMMVSKCGCAAPYYFRQSIEKLKEWKR